MSSVENVIFEETFSKERQNLSHMLESGIGKDINLLRCVDFNGILMPLEIMIAIFQEIKIYRFRRRLCKPISRSVFYQIADLLWLFENSGLRHAKIWLKDSELILLPKTAL
jgi:hypothetical protein